MRCAFKTAYANATCKSDFVAWTQVDILPSHSSSSCMLQASLYTDWRQYMFLCLLFVDCFLPDLMTDVFVYVNIPSTNPTSEVHVGRQTIQCGFTCDTLFIKRSYGLRQVKEFGPIFFCLYLLLVSCTFGPSSGWLTCLMAGMAMLPFMNHSIYALISSWSFLLSYLHSVSLWVLPEKIPGKLTSGCTAVISS